MAGAPGAPLSARNPRLRDLARLARDRTTRRATGRYVIEGPVLVGDALDAGVDLEAVYVEDGAELTALTDRVTSSGVSLVPVAAGGLRRIVSTVAPRPVAAVATIPPRSLDVVSGTDLVVVLADIRDPGNAGTLLRTAEAAGAGAVVCCGETVDPFGPKCVRASAGALFRLPVVTDVTAPDALASLAAAGLRRIGAVAHGGVPPDGVDLTGPVAVVLGEEAHGLPEALTAAGSRLLDARVTIPLAGRTESLNVAAAGAVLCFEVARQRRARTGDR